MIQHIQIYIKQDFSLDHNPLDYVIWDVLENKTNATSHPIVGLHETAIEKEYLKNLF